MSIDQIAVSANQNRPGLRDPIFTGDPPVAGLPIPAYGDPVWSLDFYNANPTVDAVSVHWTAIPDAFRDHLRLAAWGLLNVPFPDGLRVTYAKSMRPTLGAFSMYRTVTRWRRLAEWLQQRGVSAFSDLTAELMGDYIASLEARLSENSVIRDQTAILRLWALGLQLPELALPDEPPWLASPVVYGKGAWTAKATGENATEPIASETMTALLAWSLTTVEHCAAPIIAAHRFAVKKSRPRDKTRPGESAAAVLNAYLARLEETGEPLPGRRAGPEERLTIDASLLARQHDVTVASARMWARDERVLERAARLGLAPQLVPLDLPPAGAQVLPATVDLRDIPALVGLLEAACFVVIAYLTGMRVGEAMALEAGSLTPSSQDGGWMLIRSRHFKGVRDADGIHDPRGVIRPAPWVAVTPVVEAIRVLEELRGGRGLLLPRRWSETGRPRARSRMAMVDSIERFITHINGRHPKAIPPDPHGRITPVRFRRTLAWHIANQPNGLIALAIQYGHLRTAMSEGYASRVKGGVGDLIDYETARVVALNLSSLHEDLDSGAGVSGPAAGRLVVAAAEGTEQFHGVVTTARQAASLLRNPDLQVYDNETAFLWCNFRRDQALCLRRGDPGDAHETPRLEDCRPTCGNIARTDEQADRMRARALQLSQQAEISPPPIAIRLTNQAEALLTMVSAHQAARTVKPKDN